MRRPPALARPQRTFPLPTTAAREPQVASPLCVSADAFDSSGAAGVPPSLCVVPGTLINANTLEDFKEWDKAELLRKAAAAIWQDMCSGAALAEPHRLCRFLLLTFADLKTHKYYYWFAFPAFALDPPPRATPPAPLASLLDASQLDALRRGYAALPASAHGRPAFFAVRLSCGSAGERSQAGGGPRNRQ